MGNQEPPSQTEPAGDVRPTSLRRSVAELGRLFARQLFDLQMRELLTTRMLPIIYGLAIGFAALLTVYWIVWGFGQSWGMGIAWLLVIGPALFVAVVTAIRVFLEFVMTVFRIALFLESLGGQIESIAGQTEEIAEDLPRIQFWRSRKRD